MNSMVFLESKQPFPLTSQMNRAKFSNRPMWLKKRPLARGSDPSSNQPANHKTTNNNKHNKSDSKSINQKINTNNKETEQLTNGNDVAHTKNFNIALIDEISGAIIRSETKYTTESHIA